MIKEIFNENITYMKRNFILFNSVKTLLESGLSHDEQELATELLLENLQVFLVNNYSSVLLVPIANSFEFSYFFEIANNLLNNTSELILNNNGGLILQFLLDFLLQKQVSTETQIEEQEKTQKISTPQPMESWSKSKEDCENPQKYNHFSGKILLSKYFFKLLLSTKFINFIFTIKRKRRKP